MLRTVLCSCQTKDYGMIYHVDTIKMMIMMRLRAIPEILYVSMVIFVVILTYPEWEYKCREYTFLLTLINTNDMNTVKLTVYCK